MPEGRCPRGEWLCGWSTRAPDPAWSPDLVPGQWGEALERASWGHAVLLWGPVTRQDTEGVGSICPISRRTTAWLRPRRHDWTCPGTLKPASQDRWLTSALAWSLSRWQWRNSPLAACMQQHECVLSCLSGVRPFATLWTVAHRAPLSMGILQARILEWVALPSQASLGFPGSSAGEESTCSAGDTSSIPRSGSYPEEGIGYPLQDSGPSLVIQTVKESTCNVRDRGSIPGLERPLGGGHGNPLHYSCLENSHGQRSLAGYSPGGSQRVGHD